MFRQLKLQIFLPLLSKNKHFPCINGSSCPRQKFKNCPGNLPSLFPHPLVTKSCLSKLTLLPFPQPLPSQVPESCPSRGLLAVKVAAAARVIISIPCWNPFHNFQSVSEKVKTPKSLGPFLMPPSSPHIPMLSHASAKQDLCKAVNVPCAPSSADMHTCCCLCLEPSSSPSAWLKSTHPR